LRHERKQEIRMKDSKPLPSAEEERRFVSVNEACRFLSVSRSQFYRWLQNPATGLAAIASRGLDGEGHLRFPLQELQRLMYERPCAERRRAGRALPSTNEIAERNKGSRDQLAS
jgi:hypothetical protein